MKEILEKGGSPMSTVNDNPVVQEVPVVEENAPQVEEGVDPTPVVEDPAPVVEDPAPVVEEPAADPIEDPEPAAPSYSLEEIPEYIELSNKYSELENTYNTLVAEHESLNAQVAELKEFKLSIQKKEKEAMINSFYMLSDEDKKDVVDNIDAYSLEDIEAKLSIICVRNRVNFSLEEEDDTSAPVVYNLNDNNADDGMMPAWVKAIQAVAKN